MRSESREVGRTWRRRPRHGTCPSGREQCGADAGACRLEARRARRIRTCRRGDQTAKQAQGSADRARCPGRSAAYRHGMGGCHGLQRIHRPHLRPSPYRMDTRQQHARARTAGFRTALRTRRAGRRPAGGHPRGPGQPAKHPGSGRNRGHGTRAHPGIPAFAGTRGQRRCDSRLRTHMDGDRRKPLHRSRSRRAAPRQPHPGIQSGICADPGGDGHLPPSCMAS